MVNSAFLQWIYPTDWFINMKPVGHDQEILQNVYESVLCPLSNEVDRFAPEAGAYNIVATIRCFPVLDHGAIFCASEVDWPVEDCFE